MRKRLIVLVLVAVGAVVGTLVTLSVPEYQRAIRKATEAVLRENLFRIRTSITRYYEKHGAYPQDLHTLVDSRFLRDLPLDPITESTSTWVLSYEEDCSAPGPCVPGKLEVHSGASGTALDGTLYSEW